MFILWYTNGSIYIADQKSSKLYIAPLHTLIPESDFQCLKKDCFVECKKVLKERRVI